MFVVFREGVYRHECIGVFSTRLLAIKAANDTVNQESDDYHSVDVIKFEVNKVTPRDEYGILKENKIIYSVRKSYLSQKDKENET